MSALLAIDAGNTRVKWGVHDGRGWLARGATATTEADLVNVIRQHAPRAAIASNVAGAQVEGRLRSLCDDAKIPLRVIRSESEQLGVTNGYRDTRQLGSDRWAALIAAHAAESGHKLVVNAGTAVTVDALASDGRFLGGLIVPGPELMRRSLSQGTAALRLTEGDFRDFPASTPDAITSGALQACVGAIERMARLMAAKNMSPVRVLLSGGAVQELAPNLSLPHAIHENLVLDGLVLIARKS